MKSLEIVGFKRANLGKTDAKALRLDSQVPCVLYGGPESVHFSVPAILFRELLYTPEAHIVDLNVEGTLYRAVVQDAQFHPVNEMLLHVDFLEIEVLIVSEENITGLEVDIGANIFVKFS